MTTNYRRFQLALPQIDVWNITSPSEVTEALAIIKRGDHEYFRLKSNFSETEEYWLINAELLVELEGQIHVDYHQTFSSKPVVVQLGSAIVTSSNGKAWITADLDEDFDATNLPSFLLAPHLIPLG